jgi:tRNA-specific 2-thiouridylase
VRSEPLEPLEPPDSRWRVRFDAPQWAPTPGQYLVVYDGDVCLRGAVIESTGNEDATGAGRRAERIAVEG